RLLREAIIPPTCVQATASWTALTDTMLLPCHRRILTGGTMISGLSVLLLTLFIEEPGKGKKEAEELSEQELTSITAFIRPGNNEFQFERVPCINFLWQARLKAAAEGKPIFIWAAGGPPGGC